MLFILKNHPFYEQFNKQAHTNNLTNRYIKKYEIQLKKRYENTKTFNPDNCYIDTDNSELDSFENIELDSNFNAKEKSFRRNSKSLDSYKLSSLSTKKNRIKEKISFYKKMIKLLDILAVVLIILGAILSQYEQELYYFHNIIYRVPGVIMKDYIYRHPYNHSLIQIFNEDSVDLNELIDFKIKIENFSDDELSEWKSNDGFKIFLTEEEKINLEDNQNIPFQNLYIINRLNITRFSYNETLIDPANITIPLEIPQYNNSLRIIILVTTCLSIILILFSRHIEHNREYFFKKESDLKFYKGEYFLLSILEILLILPIQYPGINSYIIFVQLGSTICLPFTSILGSISIFRFIIIYKIFKNFTIWNSEYAEMKCEKYVCQADTRFAFKALQKENPFLTLGIIFVLTCVCFGFSLRNFELHFWEANGDISQNWKYHWNALWCVFVSMTTVGYGDFFPNTHLGRMIIIAACIVGIYFVSMTMVFMTSKSVLSELEMKAYKLIVRLKLRKEMKDLQAKIIFHALNMRKIQLRKKMKLNANISNMTNNSRNNEKNKIEINNYVNTGTSHSHPIAKSRSYTDDQKELDTQYSYEKRCIITLLEENKKKERNLSNLVLNVTKEQLIEICERIERDIKEIKNEIEILSYINNSVFEYSSSQSDMLRYLRKNIFSLVSTYAEIEKNPKNFGKLSKYNRNILQETEQIRNNFNVNMESGMSLPKISDKKLLLDKIVSKQNKNSLFVNKEIRIKSLNEIINKSIENNSISSLDDSNNSIENYVDTHLPNVNSNEQITPKKSSSHSGNKSENKEEKSLNNQDEPETQIRFKNLQRSNGIKSNIFKSMSNKNSLKDETSELICEMNKSAKNCQLNQINPNYNYANEISTLDVSPEEIKSHFNFLLFNQPDNLYNNTTKITPHHNYPINPKYNDSLKKDELKIQNMISMRRISTRRVNLMKK